MIRDLCKTLALATLLIACGGNSGELLVDADLTLPDADPSAPDAEPSDADPNAPDARINRAPSITFCCGLGPCGTFFQVSAGSPVTCQVTFADPDPDQHGGAPARSG